MMEVEKLERKIAKKEESLQALKRELRVCKLAESIKQINEAFSKLYGSANNPMHKKGFATGGFVGFGHFEDRSPFVTKGERVINKEPDEIPFEVPFLKHKENGILIPEKKGYDIMVEDIVVVYNSNKGTETKYKVVGKYIRK